MTSVSVWNGDWVLVDRSIRDLHSEEGLPVHSEGHIKRLAVSAWLLIRDNKRYEKEWIRLQGMKSVEILARCESRIGLFLTLLPYFLPCSKYGVSYRFCFNGHAGERKYNVKGRNLDCCCHLPSAHDFQGNDPWHQGASLEGDFLWGLHRLIEWRFLASSTFVADIFLRIWRVYYFRFAKFVIRECVFLRFNGG